MLLDENITSVGVLLVMKNVMRYITLSEKLDITSCGYELDARILAYSAMLDIVITIIMMH